MVYSHYRSLALEPLEDRSLLSLGSISGLVYEADPEFQVNSASDDLQLEPAVAADAAGNSVVVWSSRGQDGDDYGVFGQQYSAAGVPLGDEFQVNHLADSTQRYPDVAVDQAGRFVVTWASVNPNGEGWSIYARRFDATAAPLGDEFLVSTVSTGDRDRPAVATNASGEFVIAWETNDQDGDNWGIYARRYDASGDPAGSEFPVVMTTADPQRYPAVTLDDEGDCVIVWQSWSTSPGRWTLYAKQFDSGGLPQSSEILVYDGGRVPYYSECEMAGDADGDFVVVWKVNADDNSETYLYGRRFGRNGVAQGAGFRIDSFGVYDVLAPTVAMEPDGDFVVAFSSESPSRRFGLDIMARRYADDGQPLGPDYRVSTSDATGQKGPDVAVDPAGNFIVAWRNSGQYADQSEVSARRLAADFPGVEGRIVYIDANGNEIPDAGD
ncbi:MAG: hypothetical protein ACYTG0_40760, partial [Planctomycetota bacterium]